MTADARHEVDARPSDAIALAVRLDVPIFAAGDGAGPGRGPPGWSGRRRARTRTSPPMMARLDIFREFVNSLDPEGDARGGGSQR